MMALGCYGHHECARLLFLVVLHCLMSAGESDSRFSQSHYAYPRDGSADIVIGALIDIHEWNATTGSCSPHRRLDSFLWVETMRYLVQRINSDPNLLPGVTLGIEFQDVCSNEGRALQAALKYVPGAKSCDNPSLPLTSSPLSSFPPLIPLVFGPADDVETMSVAGLLNLFEVPLMSYRATDMRLSDECRYRYFSRTMPSDVSYIIVLLDMFKRYGWNYVPAVRTADDASRFFVEELSRQAAAMDPPVCVVTPDSLIVRNGNLEPSDLDLVVASLQTLMPQGVNNNLILLRLKGGEFVMQAFLDAVGRATPPNASEPLYRIIAGDPLATFGISHQSYVPLIQHGVGFGPAFSYDSLASDLEKHFQRVNVTPSITDNPWWDADSPRLLGTSIIDPVSAVASDAVQASALALNRTLTQLLARNNHEYSSISAMVRDMRTSGHCLRGRDLQHNIQAVKFISWTTHLPVSFDERGDLGEMNFDTFSIDVDLNYFSTVQFQTADIRVESKNSSDQAACVGNSTNISRNRNTCLSQLNVSSAVHNGLRTLQYTRANRIVSHPPAATLLSLGAGNDTSVWFSAVCVRACSPGEFRKYTGGLSCCWSCEPCAASSISTAENSASCDECPLGTVPNDNQSSCVHLQLEHHWNSGPFRHIVMAISGCGCLATTVMLVVVVLWSTSNETSSTRWALEYPEMTILALTGLLLTFAAGFLQVQEPSDVICGLTRPMLGLTLMLAYCPVFIVSLSRMASIARLHTNFYQTPQPSQEHRQPSVFNDVLCVEDSMTRPSKDVAGTRRILSFNEPPGGLAPDRPSIQNSRSQDEAGELFKPALDRTPYSCSDADSVFGDNGDAHDSSGPAGLPGYSSLHTAHGRQNSRRSDQTAGLMSYFGSLWGLTVKSRHPSGGSDHNRQLILATTYERVVAYIVLVTFYLVLQGMTLAVARSKRHFDYSTQGHRYVQCSQPVLGIITGSLQVLVVLATLSVNAHNQVYIRRQGTAEGLSIRSFDITSAFCCFILLATFLVDLLVVKKIVKPALYLTLYPGVSMTTLLILQHIPVFASQCRQYWLAKHAPEVLQKERDHREIMEGLTSPRRSHRASSTGTVASYSVTAKISVAQPLNMATSPPSPGMSLHLPGCGHGQNNREANRSTSDSNAHTILGAYSHASSKLSKGISTPRRKQNSASSPDRVIPGIQITEASSEASSRKPSEQVDRPGIAAVCESQVLATTGTCSQFNSALPDLPPVAIMETSI